MKNIGYHIVKGLLLLASIMPLWFHRVHARLLFFFGYNIFQYRRKVVQDNLKIAFPEKSDKERRQIARKFYLFFFEMFGEVVKAYSMTKDKVKEQVLLPKDTADLIEKLFATHKQAFAVMPHYGNWEYANFGGQLHFPYQVNSIYKKLNNPLAEKIVYDIRTRFGSGLFTMQQAYKKILTEQRPSITAFIADQSSNRESAHWLPFFGLEVPFFSGVDIMARKMAVPVLFLYIDRDEQKRSIIKAELLTENAQKEEEFYILEEFAKRTEQLIRRKPELWLWTHKRWKRRR